MFLILCNICLWSSNSCFETEFDSEATGASADQDFTAIVAYTVSDEISVAYKVADLSTPNNASDVDQEVNGVTASYTAGGMTISGKMINADNVAMLQQQH